MLIGFVITAIIIAGIAFFAGMLVANYFFNKWQNNEDGYMSKNEYDRLRTEKEKTK